MKVLGQVEVYVSIRGYISYHMNHMYTSGVILEQKAKFTKSIFVEVTFQLYTFFILGYVHLQVYTGVKFLSLNEPEDDMGWHARLQVVHRSTQLSCIFGFFFCKVPGGAYDVSN